MNDGSEMMNDGSEMIVDWPCTSNCEPHRPLISASTTDGTMPTPLLRLDEAEHGAGTPRRRVRFHDSIKVFFVEQINEDIEKSWYTIKDYMYFKNNARSCAFLLRENMILNKPVQDEQFLGIEKIVHQVLATKVLSKRTRAIQAIISAQHHIPEEELALLYGDMSQWSKDLAHGVAKY